MFWRKLAFTSESAFTKAQLNGVQKGSKDIEKINYCI